jgi:hypothetical protein
MDFFLNNSKFGKFGTVFASCIVPYNHKTRENRYVHLKCSTLLTKQLAIARRQNLRINSNAINMTLDNRTHFANLEYIDNAD